MTNAKAAARSTIDAAASELVDVSHRLHDDPETSWREVNASSCLAEYLDSKGFDLVRAAADLDTAFTATIGTGSLHIGVCAEYDALPGLGHACGHNIIAASALGCAVGLAPLVDELDLTLTVLGTPAEEGGSGKVFMLQRGAFDGMHAALMVHPGPNERTAMASLAVSAWQVDYFGRSAHASAAPDRGISASAAIALAQVGIGMLREHLVSSDRVHGIVNNGGDAPNIVPAHTTATFYVRAASAKRLRTLEQLVTNVFEGAATMTGCRLELRQKAPAMTEIRTDSRLAELWSHNTADLGRETVATSLSDGAASTDMGNVSYAMAAIHPMIAIESNGANIHEPAFATAARSQSANETVVYGAKAMAMTIIDIAQSSWRSALPVFSSKDVSDDDARLFMGQDWDSVLTFP